MSSSGGGGGGGGARYMAFSPSPSAPHSPHLSGLRSAASTALLEQENYSHLQACVIASKEMVKCSFDPCNNASKYLLESVWICFSGFRAVRSVDLLPSLVYLSELLAERHKLSPFMAVLPLSYRLLSQGSRILFVGLGALHLKKQQKESTTDEILRVTTLLGNASVLGQSGLEHGSPLASGGLFSNGGADVNGWASRFQSEIPGLLQSSSAQNWLSSQSSSSGLIVKRTIRVDIPVEKYPTYNFVGRVLGPRGNSLKRVEASTECRVLIRGRGSIKDPAREEMMRGKPGYEHLNEPLHILVEAELPVEIIDARLMQAREILEDLLKPMDESQDFYKKQQLRELAMLNGTLREEGSPMSGSVSPFHNSLGMKRAKTRGTSRATGVAVSAECSEQPSGHWRAIAPVSSLFLCAVCLYSVWGKV
ncbi:KH domain-containing protein [Senna tora]|uniref:KH domain-containing protein n=1 Tax=Senna tora TaxID=362788 RepID=A0A834WRB0_9FABA|nr:KH domain-containing protein [Senna tora]